MMDEELKSLREALSFSPANVPLRKLLAQKLSKAGRLEEAELEYRECLRLASGDHDALIGLAEVFYRSGKFGQGLVLLESRLESGEIAPQGWLIYARLLAATKKYGEAKQAYETAVAADATLADAVLEIELNAKRVNEPEERREKLLAGVIEDGDVASSAAELERPKINFGDVGGLESLKQEIRMKIIYPLQNQEMFKSYGKKVGGGILMYGPPGCGKTFLARATAGEINASFINVGINEILNLYIGESEKNLHAIFDRARRSAPCVLFFDEVDALGANRTDMRQSAGRQLINQFLSEMDGVEYSNEGVLILGATNAPWHMDPAFRRPGRFDRVLFVPPPDEAARAAIVQILLRGKPHSQVDLAKIAKLTPQFSGADLEAVISLAVEIVLEKGMVTGKPDPISTNHLTEAIQKHKATTLEWFSTAKNYAQFANQAGQYDDILKYLKGK